MCPSVQKSCPNWYILVHIQTVLAFQRHKEMKMQAFMHSLQSSRNYSKTITCFKNKSKSTIFGNNSGFDSHSLGMIGTEVYIKLNFKNPNLQFVSKDDLLGYNWSWNFPQPLTTPQLL